MALLVCDSAGQDDGAAGVDLGVAGLLHPLLPAPDTF